MTEHWTDRLSDYLDGELPPAERSALERHLDGCADCAVTLDELRRVVAAAATLPDRAPERDLWPGIEARLTPRRRTAPSMAGAAHPGDRDVLAFRGRRRGVVMAVPQLVAAGIALVVLSAGGAWLALRGPASAAPTVAVSPAPSASGVTRVLDSAAYEAAIAELEAELGRRRGALDPSTIVVVERNLAIIDAAIAEARTALEADPSSAFLNGYVADAMRRKVDLLRQATRIERTEI